MKKTLLTTSLLLFAFVTFANAQNRVKQRDLRGTWKMVIDIEDEGDSSMERIVLNAVDGFLDEIDIKMQFKQDNVLKVTVDAFGEREIEYSEWYINDAGELSFGDSKHLQTDDDNVWMFEGNRLVSFEYKRGKRVRDSDNVYLRKIKR